MTSATHFNQLFCEMYSNFTSDLNNEIGRLNKIFKPYKTKSTLNFIINELIELSSKRYLDLYENRSDWGCNYEEGKRSLIEMQLGLVKLERFIYEQYSQIIHTPLEEDELIMEEYEKSINCESESENEDENTKDKKEAEEFGEMCIDFDKRSKQYNNIFETYEKKDLVGVIILSRLLKNHALDIDIFRPYEHIKQKSYYDEEVKCLQKNLDTIKQWIKYLDNLNGEVLNLDEDYHITDENAKIIYDELIKNYIKLDDICNKHKNTKTFEAEILKVVMAMFDSDIQGLSQENYHDEFSEETDYKLMNKAKNEIKVVEYCLRKWFKYE